MDDKKNYFIAALVALLLISAVWGQKETGQRKELAKKNEALEAQLKADDEAVKNGAELRAKLEQEKTAKEQAVTQLKKAQAKIDELNDRLAALEAKKGEQSEAAAALKAEQERAVSELKAELAQKLAALNADRDKAAAAAKAQADQLAQQQALLEAQEKKLTSAATVIKQEQQQIKDCMAKVADQKKLQIELDELEAGTKQLEEERNKILAEAETLRAQVIGLERIVEERSAAMDKAGKELESCKINTSVLIARIAEQEKTPKLPMKKNKAEQTAPAQQQ